jgi:hypothetical protein
LEGVWQKLFPDAKFQAEEHSFMFNPEAKAHFLKAREAYYMDGSPFY